MPRKKKEVKYVTIKDIVIPAGSVLTIVDESKFYDHCDHILSCCKGNEVMTLVVPLEAIECEPTLFTTLKE